LGTTLSSVTSLMHRARVTMKQRNIGWKQGSFRMHLPDDQTREGSFEGTAGKKNRAGSKSESARLEPPAAAPSAATAAETAAPSRRLFASFVHGQGSAAEVFAVQGVDGGIGIRLTPHLHERKAARTARIPIRDDPHFSHLPSPLGKEGLELSSSALYGRFPTYNRVPHDPQPLRPHCRGTVPS
jgi:hypothetical protein